MARFSPVQKRIALGVALAAALSPGWAATLTPVQHDEILARAAESGAPFGVTVRDVAATPSEDVAPGAVRAAEWHAEYLDSGWARIFAACGLRGFAPSVVPPDYAAHVPASPDGGLRPADGYYRVVTSWRWPWWRPGGGVDWLAPPQ